MVLSIIGDLIPARGKATKKIVVGTVDVASGDTIPTGLSKIDFAAIIPTVADRFVSFSISGGDITVTLHDSTGADVTSAETVYVFAIGDPA